MVGWLHCFSCFKLPKKEAEFNFDSPALATQLEDDEDDLDKKLEQIRRQLRSAQTRSKARARVENKNNGCVQVDELPVYKFENGKFIDRGMRKKVLLSVD